MTTPSQEEVKRAKQGQPPPAKGEEEPSTGRMHQNVPVWSDPVCACEAEPYWQAVAEEQEQAEKERAAQGQDSEPC